MQRASGLNIDDLHDNSRRTSVIVLSADEHGDSRIVEEGRQIPRFSEPQQRTTLVRGVDQPAASTQYPPIESTVMTKNDQGRSEKRRAGSHEGKNSTKQRGRPRLNTADSTQAEKRRTQIRLAQRAFKLRQETKIQSLENKVSSMEKAISKTSKAFLNFQEKVLASGILNQAPELSHSLQSTVETLSVATAIAADRDSYGDDFEDDNDQESPSGRMSGRVEDHVAGVDHDHVDSQRRPIGSECAAQDRTSHGSIGEDIQHVHWSQQSPRNALFSDEPQAIHHSGSGHDLTHAAARGSALASLSLRVEDDETNQDYIGDLTPQESYPVTIRAAQVNSIPPRLPIEGISKITAGTSHALKKKKSTAQKAMDDKVRDREVLRSPYGMRFFSAPSTGQRMPDTPMHEVFLESFLDTFAAVAQPSHRFPDWFRATAEVRLSSPLLYDAFLAVSASYFGSSVGDSRIVLAAHRVYVHVLRELQKALLSPSLSRSQWTLFTVILAMHYEILQNTSDKGMVNHMIGALKLIEFRGPQRHVRGLEHLCFVTYRNYLITTAIACRSPTFLAREEWKTLPWSTSSASKDLVQHLLDHLADIPALLAQYDSLVEATKMNTLPPSEVRDRRTMIQVSIADIEYRLHRWKREYADPIGQPSEVPCQVGPAGAPQDPSNSDRRLPTFWCEDLSSGALISPPLIVYPEPELARALCLYYAALLTVSFVDIRMEGGLLAHERYNLACLICRSTEYFLQVAPNHSTRVLGSLRVAYDTLPEGGIERRWVQDTFHAIGRVEHMKSTASLGKDFSVLANAS